MNEEYTKGMSQLLELARDIEKTPSELHCKCKHKDAPQTPDFDWNVFVKRIDKIMEDDKVANSPFRQVRLAFSALNADLTYDNRKRAKELLHKAADTLEHQEHKARELDEEYRKIAEQEQKKLRTSTYLTDEFWQNIITDLKKCKCKCPKCQHPLENEERVPVLRTEKRRYDQFLSECFDKVVRGIVH